MEIKHIEKINKVYEQLKKLDADITALHALAERVLKSGLEVKLTLSNSPVKEERKENVFDEHGFIKPKFLREDQAQNEYDVVGLFTVPSSWLGQALGNPYTGLNKVTNTLDATLSDRAAILIIDVLIKEKEQVREVHIQALRKLGITI